ncbi:MAG: hypothetical protein CMD45_02815 [Gammaproteobacteria bacterium]|nr:hypothetical protein [Gammaproteobacteria bacterium]
MESLTLIDLIIHLADQTATHEIYTDYNLFTITKEEILKRSKENISYVIEFIKNNKVKHLIYVSSGAVYESAINENRLLETDKVMSKPGGRYYNYSINKLLTEKIIREELIKYNVKFYNLRGFTFAGPHLNLDKKLAFAEFFRNCLNNRDIHIGGNPESKRSYMYSYEFVIWCLKLFANNSHSGCYNIGSTEETTILNLAQSIKDITKSNIKITTTNELLEKNYYIPNIDLLEKEIGLTQRIMFQQIVERYYKWIKKAL